MDLTGENPLIRKCLRVSRTTRFSARPFTFLGLWNVHRYGTSRVHGERMCLTIKLFWVTSSLISFHNIGLFVREQSAEITCFKHAGTLARYPSGLAKPHFAGASSLGWRDLGAHAALSPARSVHRSRQDDRVVTHGVIMEGIRDRDRLLERLRSHQRSITMHIP